MRITCGKDGWEMLPTEIELVVHIPKKYRRIAHELARRKKLLHDDKIQEYITAINSAHDTGRISNIHAETINLGTEERIIKYYVFLK